MPAYNYPACWGGEDWGSGVQGDPKLHSKLEANLGYIDCLQTKIHIHINPV